MTVDMSRFTDRSRKVMQLANQEAQRFNHEYIGTEHILLGLVKEGSGVAANVLKNLDIDLRKIRIGMERMVAHKVPPQPLLTGKLPQTPRARKVIEYSIEEARNLNHKYVGTEHLLLGLLRVEDSLACKMLVGLGLRIGQVREEVLNLLGHTAVPKSEPIFKGCSINMPGSIYLEIAVLEEQRRLAATVAETFSKFLVESINRYYQEQINELRSKRQAEKNEAFAEQYRGDAKEAERNEPQKTLVSPEKKESGSWRDKPSML